MNEKTVIKSKHGEVLFEYEGGNTRDAFLKAIDEGVNLRGACLFGFNLAGIVIKSGTDLSGVDFSYTNFSGADFSNILLQNANFRGALLRGANFDNARLKGASFYHADLEGTNFGLAFLNAANFEYAKLRGANFSGATIGGASFKGAVLNGVDFSDTDIRNATSCYIPMTCPTHGAFVGWKKISDSIEFNRTQLLVKLEIPADARRCSATTTKCRCDKAKVLEITILGSGVKVPKVTSTSRLTCVYEVGQMAYPDSFDDDRWNECTHGIHFFINKHEALFY